MIKFKKILGVFVLVMVAILCVPNSVKAATMSEEFKTWLNKDGEFEVNAAKGTTEEDIALYLDFKYNNAELPYSIQWGNFSDDLNTFDFTIYADDEDKKETYNVKIKYNYDKKVNKVMNDYLNSTLKDRTEFKVSDLELVNYWLEGFNPENHNTLALYSGELKKLLDYRNIQLFTDSRNGGYDPFITENGGFASFQNNGISYKVSPILKGHAEHVIYIDENVGNTEEEVIKAVQDRIDNYFGKGKVSIEIAGYDVLEPYISDYEFEVERLKNEYQTYSNDYENYNNQYQDNCSIIVPENEMICNQLQSFRDNALRYLTENNYPEKIAEAEQKLEDFNEYIVESLNAPSGEYHFLKDALNNWYFFANMEFDDGLLYSPFFIVKKDSSKMVTPYVKTVDSVTNIEISTDEKLPNDTIIEVNELTSGSDYEKIVKLLDLTDSLSYDLKLYSNGLDKYITKLDSGEFEVKIPIPEDFKGKDLVVYYVKDNGEKEPYTVDTTSEPGYAIFKTTHFSIYTLGYKENTPSKVKVTFDANEGKFDNKDIYTVDDITKFDYTKFTKPTRDGYKFIGFFTEKTNGKSFEEVMNSEAGIENDMIFYARWEKVTSGVTGEVEEVPKTFDGITRSVLMGTISLVGLVGITLYLKKKSKLRA